MQLIRQVATLMVLAVVVVECSEDCPKVKNAVLPWPHLNVREKGPESEFRCKFEWNNRDHMIKKVLDRMKNREKRFIHFKVPVRNYTNVYLSLANYTGHVTWVWVVDSHEYMIYYPHNFLALSSGTMSIITQHFEDEDDYLGSCTKSCVGSCGLGKYELEELLLEITHGKQEYNWEYLCLHADYNTSDIVSPDERAFAIPDLLYYWRFLNMFYTKRPMLGKSDGRFDLPNYYCFGHNGTEGKICKLKLFQQNYYVIPLLALLIWLYCPLLIHYFPSSGPAASYSDSQSGKLFPSYKTPIYFGRFIRCILCYYVPKDHQRKAAKLGIRIRRALFVLVLILPAFRLLFLPGYRFYTWIVILTLIIPSVLWPRFLSEYIQPEVPSAFPFFSYRWVYPKGLIQTISSKVEYQLLAHVMQERIYLLVDYRFWCHLFHSSFQWVHYRYTSGPPQHSFLRLLHPVLLLEFFILGCAALLLATLISFSYLSVPLPFFCKELFVSIWRGYYGYARTCVPGRITVTSILKLVMGLVHSVVMSCVVVGIALNLFVLCYLLSEFAMFTFIGATLTPNMAFKYLTLIGAVVLGMYSMVRDLHKGYDQILNEAIDVLKTPERLKKLVSDLHGRQNVTLSIRRVDDTNNSSIYDIDVLSHGSETQCLLRNDGITIFVSKHLYFALVEKLRPVRRQVLFLLVKLLLMLFFIFVAMWVKNVYHLESKVGNIFTLVNTIAIFLVPSALQFLAYKSHFGKKSEELLKREIHSSLMEYMEDLSHAQANQQHTERRQRYVGRNVNTKKTN